MTNVTLIQAGSGVENKLKGSAHYVAFTESCEGGGQGCGLWTAPSDTTFAHIRREEKKLLLPQYCTIYSGIYYGQ